MLPIRIEISEWQLAMLAIPTPYSPLIPLIDNGTQRVAIHIRPLAATLLSHSAMRSLMPGGKSHKWIAILKIRSPSGGNIPIGI
jgi:hypothetical protein